MKRAGSRNDVFVRIGHKFAPYFNHDHFMGHGAFDNVSRKESNILKSAQDEVLVVPLKGYKKEEITLAEIEGELFISAKKGVANEYRDKFLREELHLQEHERSYKLSKHVDVTRITAELHKDGRLHILLPYSPQELAPPELKHIHVD